MNTTPVTSRVMAIAASISLRSEASGGSHVFVK